MFQPAVIELTHADSISGWDAAFEYEGHTYAEMSKEAKNKISHRGKALRDLRADITELLAP